MRLGCLSTLVALAVLSGLLPQTGKAEVLKFAIGEWPPYLSKTSPHYGFATHVVQKIFEKHGYQLEYGFFPWKRSMLIASTPEWNGTFTWTYTKEREKNFKFSTPFYKSNTHLMFVKNKALESASLNDVEALRIGITNGYTYGLAFQGKLESGTLKTQTRASDAENIQALLDNKIDVFLVNNLVGMSLARRLYPDSVSFLRLSKEPIYTNNQHVLFNKNNALTDKLIELFNQEIKALERSGEMDRMTMETLNGFYDPAPGDNV